MRDLLARDMERREFLIKKDAVPCMIMTRTGLIEGNLHKRGSFRIKDELNQEERFIAVTNVKIYNGASDKPLTRSFLALQSDMIVWVAPNDGATEAN